MVGEIETNKLDKPITFRILNKEKGGYLRTLLIEVDRFQHLYPQWIVKSKSEDMLVEIIVLSSLFGPCQLHYTKQVLFQF